MSEVYYVKNFREEQSGWLLSEIRRLNNLKSPEQFDRNMINYHYMMKKEELRTLLESWVTEKISIIPDAIFTDKEKVVESIVDYVLRGTHHKDFISESMMGELINDALQRLYTAKFDTIMGPLIDCSHPSLESITWMVKRALYNEADNAKIKNIVKYLIDPPEDKLRKLFKFIVKLPFLKDITPRLTIEEITDVSNHPWIRPISEIILNTIKEGVVFKEYSSLKDYVVNSYLRLYWKEIFNTVVRIAKRVRSDDVSPDDRWLVLSIKDFIFKYGAISTKNLAVIKALDTCLDYELSLPKLRLYLYRQLKTEGYPRAKDKLANWLFAFDRLGRNRQKVLLKIEEYFNL